MMVNTTPSPEHILRFLKCFEILSRFDAEQRLVRGYGAGFDPKEWPDMPDPDVVAVKAWLERWATEFSPTAKRV